MPEAADRRAPGTAGSAAPTASGGVATDQAAPDADPDVPRTGNPATDAALALLTQLVREGLRHIVLSPGSRSQALALVAAELERVGAVELHVRIDERVGGFLALGIAAETGHPAAVITTSGTATANLLPAVLEAHHSNVPMLVLTADRPSELRGIRSNQTTVQAGMYGAAVRRALDVGAPTGAAGETDAYTRLATQAWSAALDESGPVHLNLAFRDPLSAPVPDLTAVADQANDESTAAPADAPFVPTHPVALTRPHLFLEAGPRTIVVAGNAAGAAAERLAREGGWPLIAEASSGARFGPNLVVAYRRLLREAEFGGAVQRVVVFGHPTLSREVPALLGRGDVEVVVVAPVGEEVYDPAHNAKVAASVDAPTEPGADARAWVGRWVFASRALLEEGAQASADHSAPDVEAARSHEPEQRLAFARAELAAIRAPVTRRMLAEALWRFTWPHDRLVLGASRLVRELDSVVPGKRIGVYAGRGLAGIDGTVSTAIGIALAASPRGSDAPVGTTRVLLGDLAMLHDVGSLLFGEGERRPTVQVVVGNDGGGTIFDSLEVAATAPAEAMRRVLITPQPLDLARLADAYGWSYGRAATRGELDQALSAPPAGTSILEVPLPR
jgi:2-succinyl-5-enolpyruvyl-6-hydroxy-3-cyclohexene-1-carboxylate synthase